MTLRTMIVLVFCSMLCAQTCAQTCVEIYEHGNDSMAFPGKTWKFENPGYYQSDKGYFADDAISCIFVPEGFKVIVWEHPKDWEKGRTIELGPGIHDLSKYNFNDVATGLTVIKDIPVMKSPEEYKSYQKRKRDETDKIYSFVQKIFKATKPWRILLVCNERHDFSLYLFVLLRSAKCNADILSSSSSTIHELRKICNDNSRYYRYYVIIVGSSVVLLENASGTNLPVLSAIDIDPSCIECNTETEQAKKLQKFAIKCVEKSKNPGVDLVHDGFKDAGAREINPGRYGMPIDLEMIGLGDVIVADGKIGIVIGIDKKGDGIIIATQTGDMIEKKVIAKKSKITVFRPVG